MIAEEKKMMFTLKMLRAREDLSQDEAGERVGVSGDVWHNWEKGRTFPNVVQVRKIEEAYGVTYNEIIFLPKNNG